jgi:hypothetical protein
MYHGPYPTNSKAVAAVTQTPSPATVTVGSASTPAASPAATSQQGVVSSKAGE